MIYSYFFNNVLRGFDYVYTMLTDRVTVNNTYSCKEVCMPEEEPFEYRTIAMA